jgi:hypothetical protein
MNFLAQRGELLRAFVITLEQDYAPDAGVQQAGAFRIGHRKAGHIGHDRA